MSKHTDDYDTDRTYTVHSCEYGVYVLGKYAPTDDLSALMKNWAYRGLRFASVAVARKLDALVAVTESSGDAEAWLTELGE